MYITLPFGKMKWADSFRDRSESGSVNIPFGFTGGASFGIKIGPGILFADIRYSKDLADTSAFTMDIYKRSMLSFGIGYEIGFVDLRKKGRR
jgi:hypothetical protein